MDFIEKYRVSNSDEAASTRAQGNFKLTVVNRSGEVIDSYEDSNFIVTNANLVLSKLLGGYIGPITKLGIGTGTVYPELTDTELINLQTMLIADIDFVTLPGSCIFTINIDYTDFNGTIITEYALLTQEDSMFSRKVRPAIFKDFSMALQIVWTITFI